MGHYGHDIKLHPVVMFKRLPTSFLLLPGSIWSGVVIPFRVPSWGQVDLFENHYDGIYVNYITLCKQMIIIKQN